MKDDEIKIQIHHEKARLLRRQQMEHEHTAA
jgi:hypothetical protein